jgi:type I restriction enzyme M protein
LSVYKYPRQHIDLEFPVKLGREPKRVDIAIFNSEIKAQDNMYIVIETKKKEELDGVEQLHSYLSATTSNFGIWTNGDKILYLLKELGIPNKFSDLPDIPKYKESIDAIGRYKKDDLVKATDLKSVFDRCNNYFYVNQGLTQDKRFSEILKIIFSKIEDEKNLLDEYSTFHITPKEKESESALVRFRNRLTRLFEGVKDRFEEDNIFSPHDEIVLNNRCLTFAVAEFQKYSLLETDADIKGVAFETFVGSNLRGEHGEFFTPREVVRMASEIVMPKFNEVVCDPACGSGGFLVMVLKNVLEQYKALARTKKRLNVDALFKEYADSYIRGIDFNPDLARVAKMNMVLNDDGHTGIFHFDSLTPFDQWPAKILKKIGPSTIDIILTNPPFGKKCVIDEKKILRTFDLGHKWIKQNDRWVKTDKVDQSRTPDILFIERCIQLLKPGGRMAIVLPDGILGNDGLEYVRQYILEKTLLVGVIDLPVETFLPSVDTKTSVLVLKKKESDDYPQTFDVMMSIAKTIGHDRRGKTLYKRDEDGNILFSNGDPIPDDDLIEIANSFKAHVVLKNIYN